MAYSKTVNKIARFLKIHDQNEILDTAVEEALSHHIPDSKKLAIEYRISFLDYMDMFVSTWIPSKDLKGKDVYYRLADFYFIFDHPTLKDLQSPIKPASAHKPYPRSQQGS